MMSAMTINIDKYCTKCSLKHCKYFSNDNKYSKNMK